jgi:hypothetical protein
MKVQFADAEIRALLKRGRGDWLVSAGVGLFCAFIGLSALCFALAPILLCLKLLGWL